MRCQLHRLRHKILYVGVHKAGTVGDMQKQVTRIRIYANANLLAVASPGITDLVRRLVRLPLYRIDYRGHWQTVRSHVDASKIVTCGNRRFEFALSVIVLWPENPLRREQLVLAVEDPQAYIDRVVRPCKPLNAFVHNARLRIRVDRLRGHHGRGHTQRGDN